MSGIKRLSSAWLTIVVLTLAILGVYMLKNTILPVEAEQDVSRFMVGQETNLKTSQWNEMTTEHFKIKYMNQDKADVGMVASAAENAYTSVTATMGKTPGQQTTIVIYPDSKSMAANFGWDKNEKAQGVYWEGTIQILSPSAWVTGENQEQQFIKEGPMVHEFTHLIVDEMTNGNYNRWWTEGIAQYMEKKINGFEFASPFAGNQTVYYYTLDNLAENFDTLNQPVAYWESLKAVEFITDRYGEDKIYVILQNLSDGDSMPKATEKALGTDYQTFTNDFYQYLENN